MNGLNKCILTIVSILCLTSVGVAQQFDANTYYQQCIRLEAGGDFSTAEQSCLNALEANPDFVEAELALGRIEVQLKKFVSASSRLIGIAERLNRVEPYILLAEIAVEREQFSEASQYLRSSEALPQVFNTDFEGRRNFLKGRVAEMQGRYIEALGNYRQAVTADSIKVKYRVAEASLLIFLGDAATARDSLENYLLLTGQRDNPDLLSLLGHAKWSLGDLQGAANDLEDAVAASGPRESSSLEQDLRNLALVYYGQANLKSGNLALSQAVRRGNLLGFILNNSLVWVMVFLLLLALHLIGESRIESGGSLEYVETELWNVGQFYRIFLIAVFMAMVVAVIYSYLNFNNYLAFITPLQSSEVRAFFLIIMSLILPVLALRRVRIQGFEPFGALLGRSDQLMLGALVGVALLVLSFLYLSYMPDLPWIKNYYLDFSRVTPMLVGAVVTLPLSELFFRAFAYPTLDSRYGMFLALAIMSTLYALTLGTPVVLLIIIALILGEVFRRFRDGITVLIAQLVLHLGLLFAVSFVPWVRGLFL